MMAGLKSLGLMTYLEIKQAAKECDLKSIEHRTRPDLVRELTTLGVKGLRDGKLEIGEKLCHVLAYEDKETLLNMLNNLARFVEHRDNYNPEETNIEDVIFDVSFSSDEVDRMMELVKKHV